MAHGAALEDFQDFQARQRGFETRAFEVLDIVHSKILKKSGSCKVGAGKRSQECPDEGDGIATMPRIILCPSGLCLSARPLFGVVKIGGLGPPFKGCIFMGFLSLSRSERTGGLANAVGGTVVLGLGLLLGACSSFDRASNSVAAIVTPYQVEVVQGNFVSREQAAALEPGMTREQVRMILGTPLVGSLFHADRWDYVFTIRRKGVEQTPKRLTVFFQGDVYARSEGDELPSEEEFVKNIDSKRSLGDIPPLSASPAQLEKAQAKADRQAADSAQPDTSTEAVARSYPPLEQP